MKTKNLIYLIIAIIMVLLAIYGIIRQSNAQGKYDDFAKCLTNNEVIMYGTDWCQHCKDQKALFGKSFKLINYINCDFNKLECKNAGVEGYPTWVIKNERYPGTRSLEYLSSLSDCKL